jgi:hypothetical protein
MIIKFCSNRFCSCLKYQELAERHPVGLIACAGCN